MEETGLIGISLYVLLNVLWNKMRKTHGEHFQNLAEKLQKEGLIGTLNTQIHDRSLPELGTGPSIKDGGVKLGLLMHYFSHNYDHAKHISL